ncbi:MAG: protein-methionine-sulfoxide reductase catalytic subunit MsrP [Nitrospiraceae bacterium]|nr:protein-methionine-sulfoxide reductase catalytic subunit MsrP [Nitrospiraceae bacterium]
MDIKKCKSKSINPSEITPKELYLNRRSFIQNAALTLAGLGVTGVVFGSGADGGQKLSINKKSRYTVDEKTTSFKDASSYNNFYEFSTEKNNIAELSRNFKTRPWTMAVKGNVKNPHVYDIDKLLKVFQLEERIYRFRCVEAWSMVIPWIGFSLSELLKRSNPTSAAKYVEFRTIYNPAQMPGQKRDVLAWPYMEGLRMDEAMNPLTILAVGMYGEILPNQNGAPVRLVVPWKYGFKSIKSIVEIRLVEQMPVTSWMKAIPDEYGFYANVNPNVDHPRWSQAQERRIGEFLKRKTLMFNGYEKEVSDLYKGMDLRKFF